MSSLILSHDLHLMMLEVAVENLYVPWTSEFDKVIMKKTNVMFRMLDEEWTSLTPNRRDCRPYRGSNCENENFHGGRSVVFCVPASFLQERISGVHVQLHVRKEVCKYFEMDSRQIVGSAAVPADDLLNSIAKQIRERNEFAEHLSDFYKQQIISRSTKGTYTLLDENSRDAAATISLYIRISYLGKCVITEISCVESMRESFHKEHEDYKNHEDEKPDEYQLYLSQQLTSEELQSVTKGPAAAAATIADSTQDTAAIVEMKTAADIAQMDTAIVGMTAIADVTADSPAISVAKVAAIKKEEAPTDFSAFDMNGTYASAGVDTLADARKAITTPLMAIGDEAINGYQGDTRIKDVIDSVERDAEANVVARAKAKGRTIKDNGGTVFRKAFSTSSKSKRGRNTATIGITEREKRISLPPPRLQTYLLCCRLQPRPTCFAHCFDVLSCYCHWTACPLQFCHRA